MNIRIPKHFTLRNSPRGSGVVYDYFLLRELRWTFKICALSLAFGLFGAALLLTGCSKGSDTENHKDSPMNHTDSSLDSSGKTIDSNDTYEGYIFNVPAKNQSGDADSGRSQIPLMVGLDPTEALAQINDPLSTYEAESCALPGMDIIYTFSCYELTIFQELPENSVSSDSGTHSVLTSIRLTDDSQTTAEGIYIGSTVTELLAVYGDCEPVSGEYRYQKGGMELAFLTRNGAVISIEYRVVK